MISNSRRFLILLFYFFFISFLFFLPGSAFPKTNWLSKIWFDKWVHIGLFLVLAYLVCWAYKVNKKNPLLIIFIGAAVYGMAVEFIQEKFVTNRHLDLGDLAADVAGSFIGIWIWNLRYIKK